MSPFPVSSPAVPLTTNPTLIDDGILSWLGMDGSTGFAATMSLILVAVIASVQPPVAWRPPKTPDPHKRGTPIRAHTSLQHRRVRRFIRRNRRKPYSVRRGIKIED